MSLKMSACSAFVWVAAATAVSACSQAADPEGTELSSGSTDALNTVISCQMTDQTCRTTAKSATDRAACQTDLESCLMSLLPDAGGLPPLEPPRFDGGLLMRPPPPPLTFPDAGLPRPPVRGFDGGLPVLPPPPVSIPDGGVLDQRRCLDDMQKCLLSKTDPSTCATDARTCLTAVATAQCDDREKACLDAKLPQAFCDAQRKACR